MITLLVVSEEMNQNFILGISIGQSVCVGIYSWPLDFPTVEFSAFTFENGLELALFFRSFVHGEEDVFVCGAFG